MNRIFSMLLFALLSGCANMFPEEGHAAAVLSFHSFEGGGPRYSVMLHSDIVSFKEKKKYSKPNHKRLNGAGYDIIFTFTGLKAGETTMIIEQRSPIATNADRLYTVKVDDRLHVEIILQNVHELGRQ